MSQCLLQIASKTLTVYNANFCLHSVGPTIGCKQFLIPLNDKTMFARPASITIVRWILKTFLFYFQIIYL